MIELKRIENQIAAKQRELDQVQGSPCEVYTRIVGYYRAVKNWNEGQAAQRKVRVNYDLKESIKK